MNRFFYFFAFTISTFLAPINLAAQPDCPGNTPHYVVDLRNNADSLWISPSVRRKDLCCGQPGQGNEGCIAFTLYLAENAGSIVFNIYEGAEPSGSLGWQLDCGAENPVGTPLCIQGQGPHYITFCKPGGNKNKYSIQSIPIPTISDPQVVSDGCNGTLGVNNFIESSIVWKSIPSDPFLESLLACTTGCDTNFVTYAPGAPDTVYYEVTGTPEGGCFGQIDTVRTAMYFVDDKSAQILPIDPEICFGEATTQLTAYGTGGKPPYTYLWNTGEVSQSIAAGPGLHWVEIADNSSCPTDWDTVNVVIMPQPITVEAGDTVYSCFNNPDGTLDGSFTVANGAKWSGGNGLYLPNDSTMNATYTPTNAEILQGFIVHTLTTTGNRSCPPVTDQVTQIILPEPIVEAGPDLLICTNNPTIALNGIVSNAGSGRWSGGLGTFTPHDSLLQSYYTPSEEEITSSIMSLTLTSIQNSYCLPVSDQLNISFTPTPIADAGPDISICANNTTTTLSGTVTNAGGGVWIGGSGTFSELDTINRTAIYIPSATEISDGSVTLTFETALHGNCLPEQDNLTITIIPSPIVNAGPPIEICNNTSEIQLNGNITPGFTGTWTANDGYFSLPVSDLTNTYQTSEGERASGSFFLILNSDNLSGCLPERDTLEITVNPGPTINGGNDLFFCENNPTIDLKADITNAGGAIWSYGQGVFSNINEGNGSVTYTPTTLEIDNNVVSLIATTTSNGTCPAISDTVVLIILDAPIVEAGEDTLLCNTEESIVLQGTNTSAFIANWTSTTGGSFSPSEYDLNASYNFSALDKSNGYVDLILNGNSTTCLQESDTVRINFQAPPTIYAGNDITICKNNPIINLTGSSSTITPTIWIGNTGIFSAPENLSTTYHPSLNELDNDSLFITLKSTDSSICAPVFDTVMVTITPLPTVNLSAPSEVCANNNIIALNASPTISNGVQWSGEGIFTSSITALSTNYIPSANEIVNNTATIYATTTGNNGCLAITDSITVAITNAPIVNAGLDTSVCANNPTITLNGQVNSNSNTGVWTNGNGFFSPNSTSLTPSYTLTENEIISGAITLILVSTNNANCLPVRDSLSIIITPSPIVDAGPNLKLCESITANTLNGQITNASGGIWHSLGHQNSDLTNINEPNAQVDFTPAIQDINRDSVDLVLTSTGNGTCLAETDTLRILFDSTPVAFAGNDTTICTNQFPLSLNAQGTSGQWQGGDGYFSPNNNFQNATYTPGTQDIDNGFVNLTFTTNTIGSCPSSSDSFIVTILQGPISSTVYDTTYCYTSDTITVEARITNISDISWQSLGSGNITDTMGTSISYVLTADDLSQGFSQFVALTTNLNSSCPEPNFDTITVHFQSRPIVDLGMDLTRCKDVDSIQIISSLTNSSTGQWSTNGTGTFENMNLLETHYTPSSLDTTNQSVNLYFTSNVIGSCQEERDTLTIFFTPTPRLTLEPLSPICANTSDISLNGQVAIATSIQWSSSSNGVFSPSNVGLNTNYTLSPDDILSETVTFYAISLNNGDCKTVMDSVHLEIDPLPTIDILDTLNFCSNQDTISLNANFSNANGITWTSSGTGSFINLDTSNGTVDYIVSPADSSNGSLVFTLNTLSSNSCTSINANSLVLFSPSPQLNVGNSMETCKDNDSIAILSTIDGYESFLWSSSGTGHFSSTNNDITPVYYPSQADKDSNFINLFLNVDAINTCLDLRDSILVTFTASPTLNTTDTVNICASDFSVQSNAIFNVSTGVIWETSGTGVFVPNTTSSSINYLISPEDSSRSQLLLIATTTGNGTCLPRKDTTIVEITPIPQIITEDTVYSCANNPQVSLSATITNSNNISWSSSEGVFDNPNLASTTFTPSANQINNGFARLSIQTTNNTSCAQEQQTIYLQIHQAPSVDADPNFSICSNNSTLQITARHANTQGIFWQTKGSGSSPNFNSDTLSYTLSSLDLLQDSIIFYSNTNQIAECLPVSDSTTVYISRLSSVVIQKDSTCGNLAGIPLEGLIQGSTTTGVWSSSGQGNFSPDLSNLNATYFPHPDDILAGGLYINLSSTNTGICPVQKDSIYITFISPQTANAGPDKIVCANNAVTSLNGEILNPIGETRWLTKGSGFFSSVNSENTTYTPTAADIYNGSVTLYLSTINSNGCPEALDSAIVTITPAPTLSAISQNLCSDKDSVIVNATHTIATGVSWTSLSGGQVGNQLSESSAIYFPSSQEKNAGLANILVTTSGNGLCNSIIDTLQLTLSPSPTVYAGDDYILCKDVNDIIFTGNITVSTGGSWRTTGSGTITNLSSNGSRIRYEFSENDLLNDSISFNIETTGNSNCNAIQDSLTVYLTPTPIVQTQDYNFCVDENGVHLNGTSTIDGKDIGGVWQTLGGGVFSPSDTLINTFYTPSITDMNNGKVDLVLTSLHNGNCNAVTDTLSLTLSHPPTAVIINDTTICKDKSNIDLYGNVLNAGGGVWSSNGTGYFATNDSVTMYANYVFSAADKLLNSIDFNFTTTENGECAVNLDTLHVNLLPEPVLDISVSVNCISPGDTIELFSTITGVTKWIWASSGTGHFSNDSIQNTRYIPSVNDLTNGNVKISILSLSQGLCEPIQDSITINFETPPAVNTTNFTVCADTTAISLIATLSNYNTTKWHAVSGGTIFNENNLTGQASYTPSSTEIELGLATLIIEATSNNSCNSVYDTLNISITPSPTVQITNSQVCSNLGEISMTGSGTIANGWEWSTNGDGTFNSSSTLNSDYTFGTNDNINGATKIYLTSTSQGQCKPVKDSITVYTLPAPNILVTSDTSLYCSTSDSLLSIAIFSNSGGATWSTFGTGSILNVDTASGQVTYQPSIDDIANEYVDFVIVTTNNAQCKADTAYQTMALVQPPSVVANPNFEVCVSDSSLTLSGAFNNASGAYWSSNNSGNFTSNDTLQASSSYELSNQDRLSSSLLFTLTNVDEGICPVSTDSIIVTLNQLPSISIADRNLCSDDPSVNLSSSVITNSSNGLWSTSGDGIFTPSAQYSSTPSYIHSNNDINRGSVTLYLETNPNGMCPSLRDSVNIEISKTPLVSLQSDFSICEDVDTIYISGNYENASSAYWKTMGNGTFTPDSVSTPGVYYIPGDLDTTNGTVQISLQTVGSVYCPQAIDTLTITFTPKPTLQTSENWHTCIDSTEINLDATSTVAAEIEWFSLGNGEFLPNRFTKNPIYRANAADTALGYVTVFAKTNSIGSCKYPVTDSTTITFEQGPSVSAGGDLNICITEDSVSVIGQSSDTYGAIWSSSGNGTFTSIDTTNNSAVYHLSATDKDNGILTLNIVTVGNNYCPSESDYLDIIINDVVSSNVDSSISICADADSIYLNYNLSNYTSISWSSNLNGTFSKGQNQIPTAFIPFSKDEYQNITPYFVLDINTLEGCSNRQDTLFVNVDSIPVISLITDTTICEENTIVNLSAGVQHAGNVSWNTDGTGNFISGNEGLTTTYLFSNDDYLNDSINFYVSTIQNKFCKSYTDTIGVLFDRISEITTPLNKSICMDRDSIDVSVSLTNASGGYWSTITGGEILDSTNLSSFYVFNASEKQSQFAQVQFTATDGVGECGNITSIVNITLFDAPVLTLRNDFNVCSDTNSITLSGTLLPFSNGIWQTNGTGQFSNQNNLNTTYTPNSIDSSLTELQFIYTSEKHLSCNSKQDTIIVPLIEAPSLAINVADICANVFEVQLEADLNNANNVTWQTLGSGIFSPNHFIQSPLYQPSFSDKEIGVVHISATSVKENICSPTDAHTSILISPLPDVDAGPDQNVCPNTEILFLGTSSNGIGFEWKNANGTVLSNTLDYTETLNSSSDYIFTVTDLKGCVSMDTISIQIINPPEIDVIPYACLSTNPTITASIINNPNLGAFQWYRNDSLLVGENALTILPEKAGLHELFFQYQNCTSNAKSQILNSPTYDLREDLVCEDSLVSLNINSQDLSTVWYLNSNDSIMSNQLITNIDTTQFIHYTLTDTAGCQHSDSILVSTIPSPIINLQNQIVCDGENLTLSGNMENDTYGTPSYSWNRNGVQMTTGNNNRNINVKEPGTYTLTYSVGNCVATASSEVIFADNPSPVNLNEDYTCFDNNESITLDAGEGYSYYWTHNGDSSRTQIVDQEGLYIFDVYNELGCKTTDSLLIQDICPPTLYPPNAIKPRCNCPDDRFIVFGKDFSGFKITIFNRWGEIIYYSENPKEGWDGTYRGQVMPNGVYAWIIEYSAQDEQYGGPFILEGKVTIID